MNGKGSNPRPLSVSREEYRRNWERTFDKDGKRYIVTSEAVRKALAGRIKKLSPWPEPE